MKFTLLQTAEVVEQVTEAGQMSLWQLFNSGGWLMWVLLALGGVTIFIFVERFLAIRKASKGMNMGFMNRIRDAFSDGNIRAAVDMCRRADTPIARMVEKGIERLEAANVKNVSLTNFDVIAETAAEEGYIRAEDVARLIAFRNNPSDESWIKA